jgi:DNA-binding NarL/FixJ family response regulator
MNMESKNIPIRLVVVCDGPIMNQDTLIILTDDIELVGQIVQEQDVLSQMTELKPDVVLMVITAIDESSVHLVRRIRRQLPQIKLVVYSAIQDKSFIQTMLLAGVLGYVSDEISKNNLTQIIRLTYAGKSVLPSTVTQLLLPVEQL